MRKFIDIVAEASMPFGRLGNLQGFTFGFESEVVVRADTFYDPMDMWLDDDDVGLEEIAEELQIEDFDDKFNEWKGTRPYASVLQWINDIGAVEWWNTVKPDNFIEYGVKDDSVVRFLPWSDAVDYLADAMREEFGTEIITAYRDDEKHENKDYDTWYIEGDGSVHGETNDHGVEVVSPVFHSYEEFARALRSWLEWFPSHYQGDVHTNRSTGLHINIGSKGAQVDPLKLLLFSGEKWMTQHWRQDGNGYTNELLPKLSRDGLPRSVDDAKEFTRKFIEGLNEKSFAINLLTLIERGYVEFRPIGNSKYEHRVDEIFAHISRFVQLIQIASDPNMYRREYAKKLGQLLVGKRDSEQSLNYEQKLVKQWIGTMNFYPSSLRQIVDDNYNIVIDKTSLARLLGMTEDTNRPIPDVVLRMMLKKSGLTLDDIDESDYYKKEEYLAVLDRLTKMFH